MESEREEMKDGCGFLERSLKLVHGITCSENVGAEEEGLNKERGSERGGKIEWTAGGVS